MARLSRGAYVAGLDKFGRQITLSDPIHGASQFTWTYRADGQPLSMVAPNGNTTSFGYDDAGNGSSKNTAAGQTTRASYAWTRNRAGQVLSEASTITGDPTNGTTDFGYDQLGRLAWSTRGEVFARGYGWQAVPNRSSVTIGDAAPVTTTFDNANRPTSDTAGASYSSDAEGRLTTRPGQILVWDDLGRLTTVKDASTQAVIAAYTYDALDRLLTVDHGGSDVVRFRYRGLTTKVAQEVTPTSTSIYKVGNGWDGDRLFEWTTSTQAFYGTNGHHDVTWTASSNGALSATLRYDPWGNSVANTGSYVPAFRFQGSWFDNVSGLSWVVARWYAPALGQFISEDRLAGDPTLPSSRHRYAYGASDPVQNGDPTGTESVSYKLNFGANQIDLRADACCAWKDDKVGTIESTSFVYRGNTASATRGVTVTITIKPGHLAWSHAYTVIGGGTQHWISVRPWLYDVTNSRYVGSFADLEFDETACTGMAFRIVECIPNNFGGNKAEQIYTRHWTSTSAVRTGTRYRVDYTISASALALGFSNAITNASSRAVTGYIRFSWRDGGQ